MDQNDSFKEMPFTFSYSLRIACEWIRDDQEGFRFALSGEGELQWLLVQFDCPLAYRKIDEGDFLRTLAALRGLPRETVYEAFNSTFREWYLNETLGVANRRSVRHFVFLSQNDCIEVLSEDPPEIRKIPAAHT